MSMHLRSHIEIILMVVLEKYKLVTLTGDIMFVNGLRFITTKSRHIKFTIVHYVTSAKGENLSESILDV